LADPRFFVDAPLAAGETIALPAAVAHHALRVLRLHDRARIVLFNGRGGQYAAQLRMDGAAAHALIDAFDPVERESPLHISLIQALVASDKLDWIVEKAVELGATQLLIAPAQRSVVRLDAQRSARRLQHWRDIARAACCQCGRNRVPTIDWFNSFDAALAAIEDDLRLVLVPERTADSLSPGGARRIALAIGPEGGFTDAEILLAERTGFRRTRLGPRILRTETAGPAAMAALQALGGDFVAPSRRDSDGR
jgi:16S rRNA (uracil1498-N3)-methyltransferase